MNTIILLLLSNIDEALVKALTKGLEHTFKKHVEVRYDIGSLEYACDPKRNQYKSPRILTRLRRLKKEPGDKILGVVDVDLYSPGYDFVYGEAEMRSGIATLSLSRLGSDEPGETSNSTAFTGRVLREAVHEVGHLFGLGHCKRQKCAMRTCTCVAEVDKAGSGICQDCLQDLSKK